MAIDRIVTNTAAANNNAPASGQMQSWQKASWDDLRTFMAVAACGSMNRAAASLSESQATVGRRMSKLESALGVTLLLRRVNAIMLAPAGLDLLRVIAPMSSAAQEIDAAMRPYKPDFDRPLRITATNSMSLFLSQHMQELGRLVAPREIILLPSRRPLDIIAGEADIALRMRATPNHKDLLVRKVGAVIFAVYGMNDHVGLPMIMPSGENAVSKQKACADAILKYRERGPQIDELHLRMQAIKSGVGIGLLPCWLGDADPDLSRIFDNLSHGVSDEMYLIRNARDKAVEEITTLANALAKLLKQNRSVLMGRSHNEQE